MSGNKAIYTDAMRKGHDLAWQGRYVEAIGEYLRARDEFPDDIAVNVSLGAAYLRLNRLAEALAAYQAAQRKAPQDILSLAKIAEIQARLGQKGEAERNFESLVQAYNRLGMPSQALAARQRLVNLLPDYIPGRLRLAQAYEEINKLAEASREYLAVAQLCQQQGFFTEAIAALERALQCDAENAAAAALLETIRSTVLPTPSEKGKPAPSELAAAAAQARLAQTLLAEAPSDTAASGRPKALLTQALEYQAQGLLSQAIACYEQILQAGWQRPEIEYNLGLLYLQTGRYEESIQLLQRTAQEPELAMGSLFAIGQCYRGQGDIDKAMEYFLKAVETVNLQTMPKEQADEIIALYKSLADGYRLKGQTDKALAVITSLANAIANKGWPDKLTLVQEQTDSLQGEGPERSPLEVAMPEWQTVAEKLAAAEALAQNGLYTAAIEECFDVVSLAPFYLPAHYCLANIYIKQGRINHAVDKYLALANLHLLRGETDRAIEACHLALRVAPQNMAIHSCLADAYLKMGDKERAQAEMALLDDLRLKRGMKEEE